MTERAIARRMESAGTGDSATSASLVGPDLQARRERMRRLGGIALVYALGYILAHGSNLILGFEPRTLTANIPHALSILFGFAIFFICRADRLPNLPIAHLAILFHIVSTLGMVAGGWGWEQREAEWIERWAATLGFTGETFLTGFVDVAVRNDINLLKALGVGWVGMWMIFFPIFIRLSPRQTFVSSFSAATLAHGLLILSPVVNGVPAAVRPWITSFIIGTMIPSYVCVFCATLASRTVHKLAQDLSRARRMGSYRLTEKIGEGGMGSVWRAEHAMLARPAAIKLILPKTLGADDASARQAILRFEREAQATANLASPHSIDLYDFGRTDDGSFYFVMELLRGLDLRTLVDKYGPVVPGRAIHILRQACHSLYDAHVVGLIHRDVKPANVFVCRQGVDFDFVKVLDFGLVKQAGPARESIELTAEGITSGTPAYMPPEMVHGHRDIDGRADIYSLGCVAFWLLTGRLVFEGSSPLDILIRHVKDEPPAPSSCTEIEIPPQLDQIILDCLAKDPAERPQTARELSERLIACTAEGPERRVEPWSDVDARRWWETHLPHLLAADPVPAAH